MHWFMEVLRKYAVFSGRARRKEYWYFALGYLVLYVACALIDWVLGPIWSLIGEDIGLFGLLLAIGLFLPSLAVTVRRLHDTDRSGWWILIFFIPIVGVIVAVVFLALKGTEGENRFGPDPKASATW